MSYKLGKEISTLFRHQTMVINDLIEDLNISSGQYLFLIHVHQNPGIAQKTLSNLLNIDRANTNRALKYLESIGYIQITSDEKDRRVRRSETTDLGKEKALLLKDRLAKITEILSEGFTKEEISIIGNLLQRMDQNVINYLKEGRQHE
ncbi:MAG: MarR family transcriptional regulator [Clostridia bacterium]|nr:MarR family transcriptional regulator [Clostridia bacterium]